MGIVGAVIGAVATVASTNKAVKAQKQATEANLKIAEQQQKQQEVAYRREQRSVIREAQIRRAQGRATVQAAGVSGGSLVGGGVSSIGSQVGSTLGFGTQMSGLSSNITDLGIQSARATQRANMFGAIANIGSSVFQYSIDSMKSKQGGM